MGAGLEGRPGGPHHHVCTVPRSGRSRSPRRSRRAWSSSVSSGKKIAQAASSAPREARGPGESAVAGGGSGAAPPGHVGPQGLGPWVDGSPSAAEFARVIEQEPAVLEAQRELLVVERFQLRTAGEFAGSSLHECEPAYIVRRSRSPPWPRMDEPPPRRLRRAQTSVDRVLQQVRRAARLPRRLVASTATSSSSTPPGSPVPEG